MSTQTAAKTKQMPGAEEMAFVSSVFERHKGILYKTALETCSDRADKDAVVHEAVVRLTHYVDTLRQLDEPSMAVYLASVVRSVARNREKKRSREYSRLVDLDVAELEDLGEEPDLALRYEEEESRRQLLRDMREALDELKETDRALLVGKYLADLDDAQLAAQIGVQPSSVRMKLTRARRRMKQLMQRKEAERNGY